MAETVLPSVRGRQRFMVYLALTAGALASAAVAGFVFGLAGQAVRLLIGAATPSTTVAAWVPTVVAIGVGLDLARLGFGGPAPLTLGKQVPQEWGRVFPLPLTSVLYGARLGVGPLTILSTWMWWSALLAASLLGVWTTVAVSACFAVARMMVNASVAFTASAALTESLIRIKRVGWGSLTTAGATLVAITFLTGCGFVEGERPQLLAFEISSETITEATINSAVHDPETQLSPWTTLPAQLEDFVRTKPTTSPSTAGETTASTTVTELPSTAGYTLARLLPTELVGMAVVDDPTVDRFLTIDDAAAIQPDPTEEIALLQTRGFQGGWIRAFRSDTSDVAVAAVYEFRDSTEAEFYLEDGLITIGGYGGEFFDLPQLPDVRGFQQHFEDDGESVRTLGGAFFHQNRWHLLYLVGAPETVTADAMIPALQAFHESAVGSQVVATASS